MFDFNLIEVIVTDRRAEVLCDQTDTDRGVIIGVSHSGFQTCSIYFRQ